MPAPAFHPREYAARPELFDRILDRIHNDLPDAVGLSVSLHEKQDGYTVLAAQGIGREFLAAQLAGLRAGPRLTLSDTKCRY